MHGASQTSRVGNAWDTQCSTQLDVQIPQQCTGPQHGRLWGNAHNGRADLQHKEQTRYFTSNTTPSSHEHSFLNIPRTKFTNYHNYCITNNAHNWVLSWANLKVLKVHYVYLINDYEMQAVIDSIWLLDSKMVFSGAIFCFSQDQQFLASFCLYLTITTPPMLLPNFVFLPLLAFTFFGLLATQVIQKCNGQEKWLFSQRVFGKLRIQSSW